MATVHLRVSPEIKCDFYTETWHFGNSPWKAGGRGGKSKCCKTPPRLAGRLQVHLQARPFCMWGIFLTGCSRRSWGESSCQMCPPPQASSRVGPMLRRPKPDNPQHQQFSALPKCIRLASIKLSSENEFKWTSHYAECASVIQNNFSSRLLANSPIYF